jgi:hypothetical protein
MPDPRVLIREERRVTQIHPRHECKIAPGTNEKLRAAGAPAFRICPRKAASKIGF